LLKPIEENRFTLEQSSMPSETIACFVAALITWRDYMSSAAQVAERSAEIARVLETESDLKAFEQHLEELLHGAAFRGSHRSGQFLRYVVNQSINGHCDELKERLIGIELFGRSPSYDTGEDAIVRVTASDVRRRLLQHYGTDATETEFRIRLPLGSYIPEIVRDVPVKIDALEEEQIEPPTDFLVASSTLADGQESIPVDQTKVPRLFQTRYWTQRLVLLLCCLGIAVSCLLAVWLTVHATRVRTDSLWGTLFGAQLSTKLITSDPNIVEIQELTGQTVTLSDYANRRYVPDPEKVTPQLMKFSTEILRGDKAAAVDTGVAVDVAESMNQVKDSRLTIQAARTLRFSDLLKDGNFILLGSPRSNPWALFYNDHLDFRFVFDKDSGQEIIENIQPRKGESSSYVPTAMGFATGQSFAVASYLRNPDHLGHVLLIAGANAEGTEAAADLMTDSAKLSAVMGRCGLPHTAPIPNFQLLLRLSTMAGSPGHSEVILCHVLSR
jgi:hypothetical protein